MSKERKPSILLNFGIGGFAGMFATSCIQPVDYVKVQLQLKGEGVKGVRPSPIVVFQDTVKTYGYKRLYTGLDSALLRQATYTTTRMGIYKTMTDRALSKKQSIPLLEKAIYSLGSGGIGAFVGNPCDLALIRMQSDLTLPMEKRRNYTGVFNAISRIAREEGIHNLWRGSTPTMARAMSLNLGMLTTYDTLKEGFVKVLGDFNGIRIVSSFSAAFVACVFSLPFDNVKTKYQKMVAGNDGKFPYSSFIDCFRKTLKYEGVLGYYVGFGTYVMRAGPHVVITLLVTDFLNRLLNS